MKYGELSSINNRSQSQPSATCGSPIHHIMTLPIGTVFFLGYINPSSCANTLRFGVEVMSCVSLFENSFGCGFQWCLAVSLMPCWYQSSLETTKLRGLQFEPPRKTCFALTQWDFWHLAERHQLVSVIVTEVGFCPLQVQDRIKPWLTHTLHKASSRQAYCMEKLSWGLSWKTCTFPDTPTHRHAVRHTTDWWNWRIFFQELTGFGLKITVAFNCKCSRPEGHAEKWELACQLVRPRHES